MKREEIEQKINDFLVEEIEIDEELIQPQSTLREDMGIDSLDFVDIVVVIEKNFGFKVKGEEMAQVKTLAQFYDYIENRVNQ